MATAYGDAFALKIEPIEAEGFFAALFANDAQADAAWQEFLAHLRLCNAMWAAVDRPPSDRLHETYFYIGRACEHFDLAVKLLEAGVGSRDRELFDDGWDAMSAGEIYLVFAVATLPRASP